MLPQKRFIAETISSPVTPTPKRISNPIALFALAALLSACGGGGSGSPDAATTTTAATSATGSSTQPGASTSSTTDNSAGNSTSQGQGSATPATLLGDCFTLTPGVEFIKSNGYKELVVQEPFEGQMAFGSIELRTDDTRFGGRYQTIENGYIRPLGKIDYNDHGVYDGKTVYSVGLGLPVDMAPGQTIKLDYTSTGTSEFPTRTTTVKNETESFTFVGLENLTLGGREFKNACKLTVTGTDIASNQTEVAWFAKGFGVIRSENRDAQGVTIPGSQVELSKIVMAP